MGRSELMIALILLQTSTLLSFCHSVNKLTEYFVKADSSFESSSLCPPGSVMCHTLQYYANHSNFTNNSVFYFLEGEHLLSSKVEIKDVVNLSFLGASSSPELNPILCDSSSSGFQIQKFSKFNLKNLTVLNCGFNLQVEFAGAIVLMNGSDLSILNTRISNSSGYGLAAFTVGGSSSIVNSTFSDNHATQDYFGGNALFFYSSCSEYSNLTIDGTQFLNGYENHSSGVMIGTGGLTVQVLCCNVHITIMNSIFDKNQGYFGSGLYFHFVMLTNNSVRISNVVFSNGKGSRGVGLFIVLDEDLIQNDPFSCGKDVPLPNFLMMLTGVSFVENNGTGALFIEDRQYSDQDCVTQYVLVKDTVFRSNYNLQQFLVGSAVHYGARAHKWIYKASRTIQPTFQNVSFVRNTGVAHNIQFQAATLYFEVVINVTFIDCTFDSNNAAGIISIKTNLIFQGNHTFRNNSAFYGGGMALMKDSYLYLRQDTNILFINNHAKWVGGGMFIDSSQPIPTIVPCFYQVDSYGPSNDPFSTIKVNFVNDSAKYAGSSFYGGHIKGCKAFIGKISGEEHFSEIFKVVNTEEDPSAASSDPYKACLCYNGSRLPNCTQDDYDVEEHIFSVYVHPGEDFTLNIAVVGATLFGAVPGAIHAFFDHSAGNTSFGPLQNSQTNNNAFCNTFKYSVFSDREIVNFYITAERFTFMPYITAFIPNITVHLKPCPLGFALSEGLCTCDPVIRKKDIHCYISNQSILSPARSWIGVINESSENTNETGVIIHDYCPYGYCLPHEVYINVSNLSTVDNQCKLYRTGLLCGRCKAGYSLMLSYHKCAKCSNIYLLLFFPFAVTWLVLVVLLFALNLTVTEGTINGLIFYVNIVSMNRSIFLPGAPSHFFAVIAWLNLDFGIDTCLFDGMDAYSEMWLEFITPFYLWAVIFIIIVLYNKFPNFMQKLGGQNAVKVLATLLLLSYTKLQQTVVTIFSFTTVQYPSGAVRYVWLYDANIEFLQGKHLFLFIAGMLILIFLIIPYTLALSLFQHMQACSHHRVFRWVNKLKPIFDAYAGPYKDRCRVWTGMLLVIRTILIILFISNIMGSPDLNLLIILVISLTLSVLMASLHGIYKKRLNNILESFFYLNLGVFAGGVLYARNNNHDAIPVIAYLSVGLTLAVLVAVVFFYHLSNRVSCLKRFSLDMWQHCGHNITGVEEEEPLLDSYRREESQKRIIQPVLLQDTLYAQDK